MEDACGDAPVSGPEHPGGGENGGRAGSRAQKHGDVLYTTGDIEDVFRCVSAVCTRNAGGTPLKSNPAFRRDPPSIRLAAGALNRRHEDNDGFAFHLPPDYRFLYSAAPLAYYLGAPVHIDSEPFVSFRTADRLLLPEAQVEEWMGEMLRRTFFLDCAVRYARMTGRALDGTDIEELFGMRPADVFSMEAGERFLLYTGLSAGIPGLPVWHMASYLDPVAESVEALPFLLRSLSAIYSPRSIPMTERGLVWMEVRNFLGRQPPEIEDEGATCPVVVPTLRKAGSQLWFSSGFPIDAAKASVRAFENRQRYCLRKKAHVRVGIVCNEPSMEEEVDVIVNALSDTPVSIQVCWDASVEQFAGIFARGFDIVQLIGHCGARGFKCRDGFARVDDIKENNTPMFFFNSCSSHKEAAILVEKGSVCGVSTFFRVMEEAAVDVCRSFYLMLGAGYPASISIKAAVERSVLGKEYLLIGDGSYTCIDGGDLKRFYRVERRAEGYTLGCTMCNTDKGYIVSSWLPDGKRAVTDLGFETRPMSGEQLMAIAKRFKGFCLYNRNIYTSVLDAARKAMLDERRPPSRREKTRRSRG